MRRNLSLQAASSTSARRFIDGSISFERYVTRLSRLLHRLGCSTAAVSSRTHFGEHRYASSTR